MYFLCSQKTLFIFYLELLPLVFAICSISIFFGEILGPRKKKKSAPRFYSVVYFLMFCYGVAFTYYLWPYTGEFRIPIICYSLIIIAMLSLASYRYEYVSRKSFLACFLGAIFFVLSDSLIAYNGFVTTLAHGRVAIMFFYTLAQLLLVQGIIISENKD